MYLNNWHAGLEIYQNSRRELEGHIRGASGPEVVGKNQGGI